MSKKEILKEEKKETFSSKNSTSKKLHLGAEELKQKMLDKMGKHYRRTGGSYVLFEGLEVPRKIYEEVMKEV